MSSLLKSRKFLLLCLDTIITLILFFGGQASGQTFENIQEIVYALQPVFVAVIGGIAIEDAATKFGGTLIGNVTAPKLKAQGMVEYALILVLVAVIVIAALTIMGPLVANVFSSINSSL